MSAVMLVKNTTTDEYLFWNQGWGIKGGFFRNRRNYKSSNRNNILKWLRKNLTFKKNSMRFKQYNITMYRWIEQNFNNEDMIFEASW